MLKDDIITESCESIDELVLIVDAYRRDLQEYD